MLFFRSKSNSLCGVPQGSFFDPLSNNMIDEMIFALRSSRYFCGKAVLHVLLIGPPWLFSVRITQKVLTPRILSGKNRPGSRERTFA